MPSAIQSVFKSNEQSFKSYKDFEFIEDKQFKRENEAIHNFEQKRNSKSLEPRDS